MTIRGALAAAVDALRRGRRVLVVSRSGAVRRFRRCVRPAANADDSQLTVMTNAEVVCVDGVGGVKAVVIRQARTGRLRFVNASALLPYDLGSTFSSRVGRRSQPGAVRPASGALDTRIE